MGAWLRSYGGLLATCAALACAAALFVAKAVASAEVAPVREKVAQLEERSTNQKEKVDQMAGQINDIWRWLREERSKQ
jgi:predicted RNA methylase